MDTNIGPENKDYSLPPIQPSSNEPTEIGPPKEESVIIGGHTVTRPAKEHPTVHDNVANFLAEQKKAREAAPPLEVVREYTSKEKAKLLKYLDLLRHADQKKEKLIQMADDQGIETVTKKTAAIIASMGINLSGKSEETQRAFTTMMEAAAEEINQADPKNLKEALLLLAELKKGPWGKNICRRNRKIAAEFRKIYQQASLEASHVVKKELEGVLSERKKNPGSKLLCEKLDEIQASPEGQHALKTNRTLKKAFRLLYDKTRNEYVDHALKEIRDESKEEPGSPALFEKLQMLQNSAEARHIFKVNRAVKTEFEVLYNQAVKDTADALTLQGAANLQDLTEQELLNSIKYGPSNRLHCPNIVIITEHFNRLSHYIQAQILNKTDVKMRSFEFEKWLNVATFCLNRGDFNTAFSIYSALNAGPIYRLNKTKMGMTKQGKEQLENLNNHFSSFGQTASVQSDQMKMWEFPSSPIPFMGCMLTGLEFASKDIKEKTNLINILNKKNVVLELENEKIKEEKVEHLETYYEATRNLDISEEELAMRKEIMEEEIRAADDKIDDNNALISKNIQTIQLLKERIEANEVEMLEINSRALDLVKRSEKHLENLSFNYFTRHFDRWNPKTEPTWNPELEKWDDQKAFKLSQDIEKKRASAL